MPSLFSAIWGKFRSIFLETRVLCLFKLKFQGAAEDWSKKRFIS
jgi:hypothetical protein